MSWSELLFYTFLDTLTGHLILAVYLFTILDEQRPLQRLKKLPPLILSPLIVTVLSLGMIPTMTELGLLWYTLRSAAILAMSTCWVMWAWRLDLWRAFSAVCMAGIFQVASSTMAQILFLLCPSSSTLDLIAMAGVLLFSVAVAFIPLKRIRFGVWFRLLLEDTPNLRRTALLILALLISMEALLLLQNGVQLSYLAAYYLLAIILIALITGLVVYLAHQFDNSRRLQAQQDIIAQQRIYEQDLEEIRREVRSFRHDYQNLLAGVDRHLDEKIQASTQIGNLRIPQVRSLLLSKLTMMREKGVAYRLEVLYPLEAAGMDIWDFVRCLGILTDNAVEAALETAQPWVEIILLAQDGRVCLRVSNPYRNALDPGKMWDEGWSTKGAGRGLGLSGYQRILKGYPNAICSTTWENGVFVQELTVEGRP